MEQGRTYLGDGLYAEYDGYMIKLIAPRSGGEHWVGLEPPVFADFCEFAAAIGWSPIMRQASKEKPPAEPAASSE
jgi:hypothetical protein